MTHPDADFTAQAAALVAENDRVPEQRAGEDDLMECRLEVLRAATNELWSYGWYDLAERCAEVLRDARAESA